MATSAEPVAFLFVAVTASGSRTFGVRQAISRSALADVLRRERLLLLNAWGLPRWAARSQELGLKDHAELNDQLAQLLSRGVPLVEALDVTAQTVRSGAKSKIDRMRDQVSSGASFAEACRSVGGFDSVTVAVYQAAERTGDLAGAARQLAATARRRLAVSGKAATLMMYPAIVLSIAILVAGLMLTLIVPRLGEALVDAGLKLPWYTQAVVGTGMFLRDNLMAIALGAAAVLALVLVGWRIAAALIGGFMRGLPFVRDVVLAQECARFFSVMGAMTRSGVPLAEALGVSAGAIGHPKLRAQMETLRVRLVEGGALRTLVEQVSILPVATRKLLVAADHAGNLDEAFATLASDMSDMVDRTSARVLAVLEPALIILMFLVIGSILSSVMIPLITLSSQV